MSEAENALLGNIKKKGENSYYYAHAPRVADNLEEAKILEGEGIVTGGPPVLIKRHDSTTDVTLVSNIRNYSYSDSDDKITIYVPFEEEVDSNLVSCEFEDKKIMMTYLKSENDTKRLVLRKLFREIDPDTSSYRVRNNKIVITLKKKVSGSWYKLVDN